MKKWDYLLIFGDGFELQNSFSFFYLMIGTGDDLWKPGIWGIWFWYFLSLWFMHKRMKAIIQCVFLALLSDGYGKKETVEL